MSQKNGKHEAEPQILPPDMRKKYASPVRSVLSRFDDIATDEQKAMLDTLARRIDFGWSFDQSAQEALEYGKNVEYNLFLLCRQTGDNIDNIKAQLQMCHRGVAR